MIKILLNSVLLIKFYSSTIDKIELRKLNNRKSGLEPDWFRSSIGPVKTGNSPVEISARTSPVEIGISPVESFEKPSLLTLFLSVKTKMPHIFLVEFVEKFSKHTLF
jgi:hypothetical protein